MQPHAAVIFDASREQNANAAQFADPVAVEHRQFVGPLPPRRENAGDQRLLVRFGNRLQAHGDPQIRRALGGSPRMKRWAIF